MRETKVELIFKKVNSSMKTPISYYGGKQNLVKVILPLIPEHTIYCEPFCGGAAIFFAKDESEIEVLNDTNCELINFYNQVKTDFTSLEKEIAISLHSRRMHADAAVVYANPHMFSPIKRAWAVWMLSAQSFSAKLDGTFGYDKKKQTTTKKINNKKDSFTELYAIRLQNAQIECTDAIRIINSRDTESTFFYVDPPYFNSNCGHYDGYTKQDFMTLLDTLSKIRGKFLLSSYPSDILKEYVDKFSWHQKCIEQSISVNKGAKGKKIEVLTSNY